MKPSNPKSLRPRLLFGIAIGTLVTVFFGRYSYVGRVTRISELYGRKYPIVAWTMNSGRSMEEPGYIVSPLVADVASTGVAYSVPACYPAGTVLCARSLCVPVSRARLCVL